MLAAALGGVMHSGSIGLASADETYARVSETIDQIFSSPPGR